MNLFFFLIFFLFYSDSFSQQIITVVAQPPEKKITNDILKLPAKILANEKVQITSVVSEKFKRLLLRKVSL